MSQVGAGHGADGKGVGATMTDPAGYEARHGTAAGVGDLDPCDIARLRLAVSRIHRRMVQASSGQDLTFAQLSALVRIEQHGPLRLGELAGREQVAAPSLSRTLAPLTSAGLIGREPDPSDGRSSLVALTPAGHDLLARLRRERSELLAQRIARLGEEQREILRAAVPVLELLAAGEDDQDR